jgi:antitoxin HicB
MASTGRILMTIRALKACCVSVQHHASRRRGDLRLPREQHRHSAGPTFAAPAAWLCGGVSIPKANVSSVSSTQCEVPLSETDYRVAIRPLTAEEGGRDPIELPDLLGCMSDGETIEQAVVNGAEGRLYWIEAIRDAARMVPLPKVGATEAQSGMSARCRPKSLHAVWRNDRRRRA